MCVSIERHQFSGFVRRRTCFGERPGTDWLHVDRIGNRPVAGPPHDGGQRERYGHYHRDGQSWFGADRAPPDRRPVGERVTGRSSSSAAPCTDATADTNACSNTHADANSDSDAHANTDTDADSNADSNANTDTDTDTNAYSDANTDSHADANTDTNPVVHLLA